MFERVFVCVHHGSTAGLGLLELWLAALVKA